MCDATPAGPDDAWVRGTRLVRHFAATRRDVLLHKWYESERAGHDVGWDRALVDWMIRYGPGRRPLRPDGD